MPAQNRRLLNYGVFGQTRKKLLVSSPTQACLCFGDERRYLSSFGHDASTKYDVTRRCSDRVNRATL